jgi:hypothetical protein
LLINVQDNPLLKDEKVAGILKPITNLTDHPLFKLMGGNPHAVILAAPLLMRMKLTDLYSILNSKEMHDVL